MAVEDLRLLVYDDFTAVNELIRDKLKSPVQLIHDIANHVIQSGGKRLRCLLVLLASRACEYKGNQHVLLAAMIEFFHTATLLHDDVLDDSTLRRGKQTANSIWGNKASILAGDYLFIKSLELLIEVGDIEITQMIIGVAPQMGCGEIQQFSNSYNENITIEQYFEFIRAKTALLFAASSSMGALITKSEHRIQKDLYTYGIHLGNAFQLIDDAIDYFSDANTLGKNIGDDLANGRATLPLLYAIQHGTKAQQTLIKQSLKEGALENLPDIIEILTETKAIVYTQNIAYDEVKSSISALHMLPDSEYKKALEKLAYYVIERDH